MPIMFRQSGKAKTIAYAILGLSSKKQRKSQKLREIDKRILADDSQRIS